MNENSLTLSRRRRRWRSIHMQINFVLILL